MIHPRPPVEETNKTCKRPDVEISLQRTLYLLLLPGLDTDTGSSHLESVRVIYTRLEWLDFT